jgi:hypothetical protein
MMEVTGSTGDGKFTQKSPIYETVHAALYVSSTASDVKGLVVRLLKRLLCT